MNRTDLVCLSHLRWGFVYQRPNHLMARAARNRRVFFVEEPVYDSQAPRLEIEEVTNNLFVCTPHLADGLAPEAIESAQRDLLRGLLEERSIARPVLWFYTPMALPIAEGIDASLVVYDCMDELSGFRGAPPELVDRERALFARADLVFTGGHTLYEAKRAQHASVHAFPSSVDAPHFMQARTRDVEPEDQRNIAHPRIGYFGVIDERLDLDLLSALADARPDYQIVMVGPVVKIDPATLPQRNNIHYLGGKKYADLPRYLSGWEVAMMPFALNASTHFISPTKTLEYLAAGRPIVSTAIRDVVTPYGDRGLVRIADARSFAGHVDEALKTDLTRHIANGDAVVAQTSWDKTWEAMEALMGGVRERQSGVHPVNHGTRPVFDYLVVGAGFAGSVLAERLASQLGRRVLLCDKRPHVGGNAYDHYDEHGILVHKYGPHIFHTACEKIFKYLSQFTAWRPYEHRVLANVDGKLLPFPINVDTVNGLYGLSLKPRDMEEYFAKIREPIHHARTSEEAVVGKVGRDLYEKFFRNYTRKQWGLDPSELDAAVAARVPARSNYDHRYFTDEFQAMPLDGYTKLFENMLDDKNISVVLGADYRQVMKQASFKEMIYTGPVDAFFDNCYGKLPYRSIDFEFKTYAQEVFQPAAVVNYPNEHAYTRITEFKYLTGQKHERTSVVYEFPTDEGDPYYPVPRPENAELYRRYKSLADATSNVRFVGRLATYKYYNMDQVVAQALATFEQIKQRDAGSSVGVQAA